MIETLQDVVVAREWSEDKESRAPSVVDHIGERLQKRLPEGAAFSLTKLQKDALNHEDFFHDWRNKNDPVRHLVIQGATSAGKTLLSEMNILDALHNSKQAIVIVPLKAMVRERTEQFKRDMDGLFRVYGSSSDYMDNDERIIEGRYDVAVIVYEKFFALLSQNGRKLMENCGLLVVDELSMLSKEQRGPKLEMSLEIVRGKYPDTRIMCLATSDCKAGKISEWLGDATVVSSPYRPIGLNEYIVKYNGQYRKRYIPGENDGLPAEAIEDPAAEEGTIEVPGYHEDLRPGEKKERLLLPVMKKIYEESPDAKVLVFVASREQTVKTAKFLRDNLPELFGKVEVDEAFGSALRLCEHDEGQQELVSELIPHGLAFHHAGVSVNLREIIEEEFQRPGSSLKVIVATETLVIGVNMPFDAMVMVDCRVPKGVGERQLLSGQEYRNYIGRAGRLGQSKNNRAGTSYLFVQEEDPLEMKTYWKSYYEKDEIESSLTKAPEEELAPFFLSLFNNRVGTNAADGTLFTDDQAEALFNASLSKHCHNRSITIDKLQKSLINAYLTEEQESDGMAVGALAVDDAQYKLTPFGQHMAPYAFSLWTCIYMYCFFYAGYERNRKGLPVGVTRDDINSDKYLLEILYRICRHPEVAGQSTLIYPQNDQRETRTFNAKSKVISKLKEILAEKDENEQDRYVLWSQDRKSDLWRLCNETNIGDENVLLQAALRAILLFYWTKGMNTDEIRKTTEFDAFTKIMNGDIERLAEVVSFHLDAIQKSLTSAQTPDGRRICADSEALQAFYSLHTRVKYGMPRDLIQLANKHVHGLDRYRLLNFGKQAEEQGLSPKEWLYYGDARLMSRFITSTQRKQLMRRLENRAAGADFNTLLRILSNDVEGSEFTDEQKDCLRVIHDWDGADQKALCDRLLEVIRSKVFEGISREVERGVQNNSIVLSDGACNVKLGTMGADGSIADGVEVLIIKDEDAMPTVAALPQSVRVVMDCACLAVLLGHTVLMDVKGGKTFLEFLCDAHGDFFGDLVGLRSPLESYIPVPRDVDSNEMRATPTYRLVCRRDKKSGSTRAVDVSRLQDALSTTDDLADYEVLPWGRELIARCDESGLIDCPTVLFIERGDIARTDSLNKMMYMMRQQNFRNCMVLFDSLEAERDWNDVASHELAYQIPWNRQYNKIHKRVVRNVEEAEEVIRAFVSGWKHPGYLVGISYAHYEDRQAPADAQWQTDVGKLSAIAERLREEYGEDVVLFDRYTPAKHLFTVDGQQRSLEAYGNCKLYLVLCNRWTKDNGNCQNEYDVIERRRQSGEAKVVYLTTGRHDDRVPPAGQFSIDLNASAEESFERIRQAMTDVLNGKL